jgi:hypothetical protein
MDKALFFASTVITVGDGAITPFWDARWLNGVSLKELAPNLYKQARFKFRTVGDQHGKLDGQVCTSLLCLKRGNPQQ